MRTPRAFQQWRRAARFFQVTALVWQGVDSIAEFIRASIPEDPPKREPWKPRPIKLDLMVYEPRFMPGTTVGATLTGFGSGLSLLGTPAAATAQMRIIQSPSRPLVQQAATIQQAVSRAVGTPQAMSGAIGAAATMNHEEPTARANRDIVDQLTDPFGDLSLDDNGQLQGAQSPGGSVGQAAKADRTFATAPTDGGGSGQSPKGSTPDTSAAPMDLHANQTPLFPPSVPAPRSTGHAPNTTPPGFGNDASTHLLNPPAPIKNQGLDPLVGGDPMWVLDANKGIVVTPGTPDNEFSNWSMDLRAQVSGANVNTYSWSTANAPDATSITGASTYNLKFTWANFSGAARTDTVVVTETPTVGGALTQTLTFDVASTSSPAYTASAPTSASTWPNVITPDTVMADQQMVSGSNDNVYQVGLVSGELQTAIHIPSYNPGVPAPNPIYSSLAADPRPIFIVHFPIDSSQAAPNTITAQLTLNGTTGEKFFYNTSQLNPGDIMQIGLQADATGLSTGRYSYSIAVTADYATPATTTYTGNVDIINDGSSVFGSGWSLDQVQRLFPVTGGVILENPGGTSLWFASGTGGSFTTPAGDFSTLSLNTGTGVYTRTMTDGTKYFFNSSGLQTSWQDRNGNTCTDGYSGSNLVTITDPYNQVTTLTYTSGYVTSITDPAGRTTSLGRDASHRLTQVTQTDGSLFTYTYDGTSGRILTIKNPDAFTTTISYNFAERVSSVARPDGTTDQVSALQMQGLIQNYSTPIIAVAQSAISTSNTVNFAPTASGDLLLAIWYGQATLNNTFAAPTTPTGWTLDKSISTSTKGIYVYEKANASSIYSLSFSGESVDNEGVYFLELAGATTTPKDVSATNSGTSTSLDSGTTAATAQANELAIAGLAMTASSSTQIAAFTSPTNGFTLDQQQALQTSEYINPNSTLYEDLRYAGLYKILSATGTQDAGASDAASHPWEGAIVTYKLSGAASTPGTGATPNTAATPVLAAQAVASYTDPRNNVWPYGIDWTGFGHVTQATDPLTNLSNTYRDANGLAWMTADQLGNRTRYNFDSSGNITKVTNPDDTTRAYVYNSFAEVTQFTDEASNITTYTFDGNGNLTQQKDALSDITTFTNNSMGFRTSMTDPDGHITTYTLDTRNRTTQIKDAAGGVVTMGYDAASNMTTRVDQRGYTTTFSYDGLGRQLTEALPDSNPSNHPVVTFQYDSAGNRTAVIDPLGDITTTVYDSLNRPTVTKDPLGNAVTVAYDNNGNSISSTDAVHGTTTFTFDAANREIAVTNPLGQTTTLTLDADGRTSISTDALNLATTTTYTSKSQVYTKTDPLANLTTYAYTATGQTTSVKTQTPAGGGHGGFYFGPQADGVNWTYTYDALNRKATGVDPLGNTVTFQYDAASNQTAIIDRLGHIYTYGYDVLNRQITTKDPLGEVTTIGYDLAGNKITQTDPLGRVTTYGYDAQNRLITVTDPRGAVTSYAYDLAGRQTSITDPDGNTTTYTFDAAGRKTAEQNPLGTATFAYDAANQLTSETDKDGRRRDFTYDNAGRTLTEKWYSGGSVIYTATMTYNSDGWLKTEQDNYSTYSMSYDADGHLSVVDNNGTPGAPRLILTLTYDGLGNRTGLTDNYGGSISYLYDNDSNRTWESMTVSGTQGPQVTLSYDADQRMTSILRATSGTGPTITTNFGYDNADRVTTITHSSSSAGALATYLYSYDAASQLSQYNGPEGTLTYTYDLSGELTNVGNARLETYSYDLNGNRNYGSYTTASDNRLTADGTYTFGYDAEGNMTSKTRVSDGETWTYTWDDRNRLTQVVEKTSGGVTVTTDQFTFDVENRRIGKSLINGTQTWFGYDAQNSYADFNGSGSLTMRYLTGSALDSLYARFDGTNTGWYLDDVLGSVRQVANTSGTVLDALTYDSYGQILSESNSSNGDRFKYTSREWDSEIGQYYYRARSYSAFDGRFISQDPLGFGGGDPDFYRYVGNRPQQLEDPSGELALIEGLQTTPQDPSSTAGVASVTASTATSTPSSAGSTSDRITKLEQELQKYQNWLAAKQKEMAPLTAEEKALTKTINTIRSSIIAGNWHVGMQERLFDLINDRLRVVTLEQPLVEWITYYGWVIEGLEFQIQDLKASLGKSKPVPPLKWVHHIMLNMRPPDE